MSVSLGWQSRKHRREAAYQRGYEAGLAAATVSCGPVAYLRHGEQTFVQNVPFGAMWISDKDDPRSFPVYERPQQPAPSVAVKALDWEAHNKGWRGCASIIYDVYPVAEGEGWWAALSMAGYLPFRERCKSPDAAKAAAQADYEARVRSALSAQVQDVAGTVVKLGSYGKAYDTPEERRAYTYDHQPQNNEAYKLGRACSDIHSGGDWIDRGLNLLNALQREGFGVYELPAAPAKYEGGDT